MTPTDYTVHKILQARILEQVAFSFSKGLSQPRDQTQVSHISDSFFTSWATGEAQEYWSGKPIPSRGDLPNSGIKPGSPALQADSLLIELSGKPTDVKAGPQRRLSAKELMLSNCSAGEDSWESLGQQEDQTSQS